MLRMPAKLIDGKKEDRTDYSILNKAQVVSKGSKFAIIGISNMLEMAIDTANEYEKLSGEKITVINPKFLTGLDESLLEEWKVDHQLVITLEDGELEGGYGQRVASFYGDSDMKVKNLGISKEFHTDYKADELLAQHGMSDRKSVV